MAITSVETTDVDHALGDALFPLKSLLVHGANVESRKSDRGPKMLMPKATAATIAPMHRLLLHAVLVLSVASCTDIQPREGGGGSGGEAGTGGAAGTGGGDGGSGGTGGACSNSGLEPEFFAECVAESCCTELKSCVADEACSACLTSPTGDCATNSLFMPLRGCLETECPLSFCGTSVGLFAGIDPIACNKCIDANCCVPVVECLGGEGEPDFDECVACIDDPIGAACMSALAATQVAAVNWVACQDTSCAVPCAE